MVIKMKKIKYLFIALAFTSCGVIAAERVVEDSLVYDDPTVSKPGEWKGGVSFDLYRFTSPVAAQNTQGQSVSATQNLTQPGVSGFVGYGDFTLMASYRQGQSTTQYGSPVNNTGTTSAYETEFDLRYLITPLAMEYFVPYVLASYLDHRESDYVTVYQGGVQEHNWSNARGPGAGLGGIIPITDKFGFRVDERIFSATNTNTSNLYSAFNYTNHLNVFQTTIVGYYNITENINAQAGFRSQQVHQSTLNSTTNGVYATLGYTF
jgi:hypothetical protein